jgi:hypothetical protein
MDYRDIPDEILHTDVFFAGHATCPTRRELLPLLAALPLALSGTVALAGQINPSEAQIGLSTAQRGDGDALRRLGQARTISCLDEVVPGLYERSAYLRHRSPLARPLRHVVG